MRIFKRKEKQTYKTSIVCVNMGNIDAIIAGANDRGKYCIEFFKNGSTIYVKGVSEIEEFDTIEEANSRAKELAATYFTNTYTVY